MVQDGLPVSAHLGCVRGQRLHVHAMSVECHDAARFDVRGARSQVAQPQGDHPLFVMAHHAPLCLRVAWGDVSLLRAGPQTEGARFMGTGGEMKIHAAPFDDQLYLGLAILLSCSNHL